jgi:putative colanic acid biosynthesis glycosyltransferase
MLKVNSTKRNRFELNTSGVKQEGGLRVKGVEKQFEYGKPLLSVITVVFNDAANLENVIKNVTSQSYLNLEYIIIDGGSSDGTLDIIKKYEDMIDYWVSEKDQGIYDAMNKGVRLASGEWINFMNAGDSFYQVTTVVDVVNSIPPSADLVYGHTYYKEKEKMTLIETYDLQSLWMSMICSHQSIFVRKRLLREHPFDIRYKISSDFEFIYYCYVNGYKFFDTKIIIAVHSVDGVSEQNITSRMLERWRIVNRYTPTFKINAFYFKLLFRKIKRVWGKGL